MAVWRPMSRLLLATVVVLALAAPVSAAGAIKTTITATVLCDESGCADVGFTATGGAICAVGDITTDEDDVHVGGAAGTFHGIKALTCPDGTFRITFDVGTHFGTPQDQGGWRVIDGTGKYSHMTGGGNLVGTFTDFGITDVYTGSVHL